MAETANCLQDRQDNGYNKFTKLCKERIWRKDGKRHGLLRRVLATYENGEKNFKKAHTHIVVALAFRCETFITTNVGNHNEADARQRNLKPTDPLLKSSSVSRDFILL
jgi:hypothetical protein